MAESSPSLQVHYDGGIRASSPAGVSGQAWDWLERRRILERLSPSEREMYLAICPPGDDLVRDLRAGLRPSGYAWEVGA